MKRKLFGKYGLIGRSGFTGNRKGILHISANYDNNRKVFVDDGDMSWKRTTLKQAIRQKKSIVRCALCKKSAVSLDHFYPYMSENNRCKEHFHARRRRR